MSDSQPCQYRRLIDLAQSIRTLIRNAWKEGALYVHMQPVWGDLEDAMEFVRVKAAAGSIDSAIADYLKMGKSFQGPDMDKLYDGIIRARIDAESFLNRNDAKMLFDVIFTEMLPDLDGRVAPDPAPPRRAPSAPRPERRPPPRPESKPRDRPR